MLPPPPRSTLFPYTTLFRSIEPEEKEVIVRYRIDGELYVARRAPRAFMNRSEEHTSELQSPDHLVCRILLEKKKYQRLPPCRITTRQRELHVTTFPPSRSTP